MIEVFFSISAADWEVFPIRVSDFKPCHSCFWLTLISTPSPSPLPLLPLPLPPPPPPLPYTQNLDKANLIYINAMSQPYNLNKNIHNSEEKKNVHAI